jgi:hypothetical protein
MQAESHPGLAVAKTEPAERRIDRLRLVTRNRDGDRSSQEAARGAELVWPAALSAEVEDQRRKLHELNDRQGLLLLWQAVRLAHGRT